MIASLGNSPLDPENIVKVLSLGRFNWGIREILALLLKECFFTPISKSLFFELFRDAISVFQYEMNMQSVLQSNLTTLMDNLINLKQWFDK